MSTSHLFKKDKQKIRNAERKFERLTNNKKKWDKEQEKMKELQDKFIAELKKD